MKVIRLAVFGVLALSFIQSCAPFNGLHFNSPKVAAGILDDNDFTHNAAKSAKFTTALLGRFPLGSQESILRSEILAEGFALECPKGPYRRVAANGLGVERCQPSGDWTRDYDYFWGGIPCSESVSVAWLADSNGRITSLTGNYGQQCI